MSPQIVLGIAAVIIGPGVALRVAHLHRKQMCQIELHRLDPSVPLEPPPGPVWQFVRIHAGTIGCSIAIIECVVFLIRELLSSAPLTRAGVFTIAWNMSFALFLLDTILWGRAIKWVDDFAVKGFEITRDMNTTMGKHVELTQRLTEVVMYRDSDKTEATTSLSLPKSTNEDE